MIAGKKILVLGYGDVGKGSAMAMKNNGGRVFVAEVDPICALQALMEGFEVVTLEDVVHRMDIFVTATGNRDIICTHHIQAMKNNAIVCNIGHFDNEIQIDALAEVEGIVKVQIKSEVHRWVFPDGHGVIILAEGRLVNLGCATGHPSFVMSASFTNQTLAQIELWKNKDNGKYERKVYKLPRELDEMVARLHLDHLGAKLTVLKKHQADYIHVAVEGPYKKDDYKY